MNSKKRHALLRPIAWLATIILSYVLYVVAILVCNLGHWAVSELSGLSTLAIIALVMLFGSVYLAIYFYSAFLLPSLLVSDSDWIYPSKHAFRYYFCGILMLCVCVMAVIGGIRGFAISSRGMFWFYAECAHMAIAYVVMIVQGHTKASEREQQSSQS